MVYSLFNSRLQLSKIVANIVLFYKNWDERRDAENYYPISSLLNMYLKGFRTLCSD